MSTKALTSPEEQTKAVENSVAVIRQHIVLMRKCLDSRNHFMDALKHASTFLNELRNNSLSPKEYYELYIMVYDGLEYLSEYLRDTHPDNHLADLYELVQYAGNIIPRLYLMITVGSVYMGVKDAPIKEIMNDMLEMCRGVQHPIRGLFLRYYLSQRTKDLLPTNGLEEEDSKSADTDKKSDKNAQNMQPSAQNPLHGDVNDSIHFIITNFIEMNKLWVRWQHQGHSSEFEKRTEERKELQVLVGSNLVRISQLEAIKRVYYKKNILPLILEQIVKCRDVIAQEYLLDVIIQVFPDEFHLITMDELFNATLRLDPAVSSKKIILSLVERLIAFKKREPEYVSRVVAEDSVDIFGKFIEFIDKLLEWKPDLSADDYCKLLCGLCRLSVVYYSQKYENLDSVYEHAVKFYIDNEKIKKSKNAKEKTLPKKDSSKDNTSQSCWKDLLTCPVYQYSDVTTVLKLGDSYLKFVNAMSYEIRKSVCRDIITRFLKEKAQITTDEELRKAFLFLDPFIRIQDGESGETANQKTKKPIQTSGDILGGSPNTTAADLTENTEKAPEDSMEIQKNEEFLSKFIHTIYNKNPYKNFELLESAQKELAKGEQRVKYTYPALVSTTLKLIRKLYLVKHLQTDRQKKKVNRFFTFISAILSELSKHSYNAIDCFNMNLTTAEIADEIGMVNISYDFFIESLVIYEQFFLDSRSQYQALMGLINKLIGAKNLMKTDNFDRLITRTTIYCSKLLRKTDQCRAIYMASHLWWIVDDTEKTEDADESEIPDLVSGVGHLSLKSDGKRVLECLQRALRTADSILDSNVSLELFIEILNQSLYFFIHGNNLITVRYLNGLIELIENNFSSLGKIEGPSLLTWNHFQRTLKYVSEQKAIDSRFDEVHA